MPESDKHPTSPPRSVPCPHCEHPQLLQIRGSDFVVIYKCPNCGELVATVKPTARTPGPQS